MNKHVAIFIGLSAVSAVSAAFAADVAGQIKARQDYFHSVGGAMKGLSDELKKTAPATGDVQKYAATLDALAPKLTSYFPVGTGPESGVKTGAKPEVWQKKAEFESDSTAFADAARKLNMAAKSGDLTAIKTAHGGLGTACKTCHQTFRNQDK